LAPRLLLVKLRRARMRILKLLGFTGFEWKTCWRSLDFWVAMATLFLPFGFVLQILRWEPVRVRVRSLR
jgi:hypothetical protein